MVEFEMGKKLWSRVREKWNPLTQKWKRLTSVQRLAIIVSTALLLAVLFPPFHFQTASFTVNLGFRFLFTPPVWSEQLTASINTPMLAIEVAVILAIGGAAYLAVRNSN